VIPEKDLYALAGSPRDDPPGRPRPVEEVMARGTRIRHHRIVLRVAAMTVLAAAVAAASFAGSAAGGASVRIPPATTTGPHVPVRLMSGATCAAYISGISRRLPLAQVPDDLRLIPTRVPGDPAIGYAAGRHIAPEPGTLHDCNPIELHQDTLKLVRSDEAGTYTATFELEGPYSKLDEYESLSGNPRQQRLRGTTARVVETGAYILITWAEPAGAQWKVEAEGLDLARVRAIVEALRLDSDPPPGQPPARLPGATMPAGFQVVSQATSVPSPASGSGTRFSWAVQVGTVGDGTRCNLEAMDVTPDFPFPASMALPGTTPVRVGGHPGLWFNDGGGFAVLGDTVPVAYPSGLVWRPSPGVIVSLGCSIPHHGAHSFVQTLAIAESVRAVAPDDPRLPKG